MTLTLPIPDRRLSPNARVHWSGLSKAKKAARTLAHYTTLSALQGRPPASFTRYRLVFYFKTTRRRDDDNWSAACKAYRDGLADGLGLDDHALTQDRAPEMLISKDNPRLEITLLP